MRPIRITGGRVLTEGSLTEGDVLLRDGRIALGTAADAASFDARGLLVLPGIVDLHGDAFERAALQHRSARRWRPVERVGNRRQRHVR